MIKTTTVQKEEVLDCVDIVKSYRYSWKQCMLQMLYS